VRILITGGRGQLGRELQRALRGEELLAPGREELDVRDGEAVLRAIEAFAPDIVIHAAAYTDTAGCERDPQRALSINAQGTYHVALACRRLGLPLVYISTNEVFSGQKGEPYLEGDEPAPINVYGRSKLLGERHVQELVEEFYIVRTAWLYARGGENFPAKILRAAAAGDGLRVVTDEVSSPTWARDLAEALAHLIRRAPPGIYHLTNGGSCSRYQWARKLLELLSLSVPIEAVTQAQYGAPYRKPPFSALANTAAARLGIVLRPWEEALAQYLAEGPL